MDEQNKLASTPGLSYDPKQDEEIFNELLKEAPLSSVILKVGEYLGQGEHSYIFKGQLVGSKRLVSIKVDMRPLIDANYNAIDENYDAVVKKVKNLKALHHPGIAELIDFIPDWDYINPKTDERGRSFIIMQYIEGKSLNQVLVDEGPVRQKRVLNWTIQLLSVLRYLHNNGRIAGHIQPSNLVLGPRDRICMIDFEYITSVLKDVQKQTPPKPEETFPKPEETFPKPEETFPKPEETFQKGEKTPGNTQIHFARPFTDEGLHAGVLSDIAYLGATMFELLTGTPWNPADDAANEKLFDKANVLPSVRDVIRKALSKNSSDGYRSALEMEQALRNLPRKDKRAIGHIRHCIAVSALCVFLLILGGCYYVTGQSQINRVSDMNQTAADASTALGNGDYTNALRLAMAATERTGVDPPVTASAQAALAEVLSAYDYVPGYKPLRSDFKLSGRPQKATFSPDGDLIAILTNDSNGKKHIQIFEAKSGEIKSALEVRSNENSAFLFIGYDVLLYAGKDGLTSYDIATGNKTIWDDAPSTDKQTGLTLSADGKVVAYVVWETREAYIFDVQEQTLKSTLKLEESPEGTSSLQQTFLSPMEHMAVLDATGQLLAVSLPGGGTGLFRTDESGSKILSQTSQYRYFEGGFWGHFFFYTASNAWTQDGSETYVQTECCLIDLNDMGKDDLEPVLQLQEPTLIHVQADENGIYLSIGNELYRVDTDDLTWEFLVDVESPILSLHHAAGRLLVITSTKLALVYRENGAWRVEVAKGQNYSIADLSKNYLFLATTEKALLSVLEWNEEDRFLQYDEGNGKTVYSHIGAHLHADGETVLLFNEENFRIYNVETGTYEEYDLPPDVVRVSYHRSVADGRTDGVTDGRTDGVADAVGPDGEYLKVVREDSVEFYSAKTGDLWDNLSRGKKDEDAVLTFKVGGWLVRQKGDGPIEISYGGNSRKLDSGNLIYACEQDGYLLLSLGTNENERRGYILNQQFDEIAALPGFCETTPDRKLLFDDQQGNLRKGPLHSVEDLRTLANQKLEAGET